MGPMGALLRISYRCLTFANQARRFLGLELPICTLDAFPDLALLQPDPLLLWQSAHEEILRDHLKEQGIEIEWGTELKGFEDSQDRVTVQLAKTMEVAEGVAETTSCQYLFGADGARSIIRKTLGLPFLRDTTDRVIVGVIQANNLSTDVCSTSRL